MEFYSKAEKCILQVLSADSRASITQLAEAAKCSRATVVKSIERLDRKLDIRYTLDIDENKLGGSERHIVTIKFMSKPPEAFLREFFKDDVNAQEVYALDGDFDLLIYARMGDPESYIVWETYVASQLSEYRPIVRPSEFVITHWGFWPLNDSFIDEVHGSMKLDALDKKLLVLLNQNSRMTIKEMASRTGMQKGTIRYRLVCLKESGIIRRFTIAVQKPPQEYQMVQFINYRFNKNFTERFTDIRRIYLNMDGSEVPVLNKYQIIAPISGSFRSFVLSIYDDKEEAESNVPDLQKRVFKKDNIEVSYARISKVIKGLLPYRNLDVGKNYVYLKWRGGK
jgi:DNA-binding Lrp family transcriptional regulator